jgi:hypothetical protein
MVFIYNNNISVSFIFFCLFSSKGDSTTRHIPGDAGAKTQRAHHSQDDRHPRPPVRGLWPPVAALSAEAWSHESDSGRNAGPFRVHSGRQSRLAAHQVDRAVAAVSVLDAPRRVAQFEGEPAGDCRQHLQDFAQVFGQLPEPRKQFRYGQLCFQGSQFFVFAKISN